MNLLNRFLYEKDLENEIKRYYKEGGEYHFTKQSSITGLELQYKDAQLMSMFSVDAEVDIFNILKLKYGNRTKHNGGTQPTDINIEGTNLSFNVKVSSTTVSAVKLCAISTPKILKEMHDNFEYRFLAVFYRLNDEKDKIIFEDVCVFNYSDIEPVVSIASDGSLFVAKGYIYEYKNRRDRFVHGDLNEFRDMSITSADNPYLTEKDIQDYLMTRDYFVSAKKLRTYFLSKDIDVSNINQLLAKLVRKGKIIEDNETYKSKKIIVINNKLDIAKKVYQEFKENKLKKVSSLKDLRKYLVKKHKFTNSLASKYVSQIEKEEKILV